MKIANGKNLFTTQNYVITADSNITITGINSFNVFTRAYQGDYNYISYNFGSLQYTFSFNATQISRTHDRAYFLFFIYYTDNTREDYVMTLKKLSSDIRHTKTSSSAKTISKVCFGGWGWSGGVSITNFQMEVGLTATTYVPYRETRGIYNLGRLPCQYQEVEYLQSTGTQYIDTGVNAWWHTGFYIKDLICFNLTSDTIHLGLANFLQYGSSTGGVYLGWYGTDTTQSERVPATADTIYEVYCNYKDDNKVVVNGTEYSTPVIRSSTNVSTYTITLFARRQMGEIIYCYAYIKVYECKITNNDKVIRHFIPCYRKSDNEAGMYDLINEEFYTNQGSGSFIVGNPVSATPKYKVVSNE